MVQLPVKFSCEAKAGGNFEDPWEIATAYSGSQCSIPIEFGGKGGAFSPEDLFLQALINCFIGTFKVYTKASKVLFSEVKVRGSLIVDKNESGKIVMQKALLDVVISGADRPDRIQTLVEKSMKEGFILNSVKTEIVFNLHQERDVAVQV